MSSKLSLSLAGVLALAAAVPAFADHGAAPHGHDDVDYGDTPSAAPWGATHRAAAQDDSRMQPPEPAPGTEATSGTTSGVEYDAGTMRPVDSTESPRELVTPRGGARP